MKLFLSYLSTLLLLSVACHAQNPAFTFNVIGITKNEGVGNSIVAYIKSNNSVTTSTSVDIEIKSGSSDSVQINNFKAQTFVFNIGVDSLPFALLLTDDTLINPNQKIVFALRNSTSGSTIGTDSLLTLTMLDNDLPATVTFQTDTASRFEHDLVYPVCVNINNPNSFAIRYYMRSYDCGDNIPGLTACGGYDYSFDWGWHFAPPGISSYCENIRMVDDLIDEPDEKLKVILTDSAQGNIFGDSILIFTIRNDDYYFPPSISFDYPVDSNWEDSSGTIAVPLTIINYNYNKVDYNVVPDFTKSTATTGFDFVLPNTFFSHGRGTFHDTAQLKIIHDFKVENTESVFLRIAYKNTNTSPDSNFIFYIKDRDSVKIGFIGAGYTHVESEGTCLVPIVSTSAINYPISIDVKYLNGNATPGVDFLFSDTTIIFPVNSSDTQYAKVTILEDLLVEGNEQVNLYITNPNPNFTRTGVLQYTFTIIDNDTAFTAIKNTTSEGLLVYPNPAKTKLFIESEESIEQLYIYNTLGEKVYSEYNIDARKHTIDIENLPIGLYFLAIEKRGIFVTKKIMKE